MAFLNVSLLKWTFVSLLALPAAEVICFLLVAAFIGWFRAGMLFVATSLLGIILLMRSGRRDLSRLADAIRRDGIGALHLNTPGVANVTGAVLLIIPGFLTDFLGAALMVPSWRDWFGRTLVKAAGPRGGVIDLAPGEWHQLSDPDHSRPGKEPSER
ncbi:MAG TPA: FxsA family protein [Xanthobacteraceae bacterium]|jgi:UPF0716 protein FxsA